MIASKFILSSQEKLLGGLITSLVPAAFEPGRFGANFVQESVKFVRGFGRKKVVAFRELWNIGDTAPLVLADKAKAVSAGGFKATLGFDEQAPDIQHPTPDLVFNL